MSQGLRENLTGLAHDALTLAELQMQLFSVDLRDARRGAGSAIALIVIGVFLAVGCIPLLMLAAAQALIQILQWSAPAAYAAVGVGSAIVSAFLVRFGWGGILRSLATMQRSRAELGETLRWMKASLKSGVAPRESGSTNRIRNWRNSNDD